MDQKQELAERLKQATNILVTVSNNPSVDQLASCMALAIVLNKMGKHATAVFSGVIPSTIEFLQPEKTIEKDTESLRDFIIALDKSKADKLRYKVEDKIVKIFITPYKTSLSEKDLEFSQGDFNVDVVVAIGIKSQADVDTAITAHGRILHDATVATINVQPGGELGSINWVDSAVSSLSEMIVALINATDKQLLDGQVATALLTGIVAETDRFSNEKTSPQTMTVSAELMAAGANQQLVVSKLKAAEPKPLPLAPQGEVQTQPNEDGVLRIQRKAPEAETQEAGSEVSAGSEPAGQPIKLRNEGGPVPADDKDKSGSVAITHLDGDRPILDGVEPSTSDSDTDATKQKAVVMPQINIDAQGSLHNLAYEEDAGTSEPASTDPNGHMQSQRMVLQPPSMGGQLTANSTPEGSEPPGDPLSLPAPGGGSLLQRSTLGSSNAPAAAEPIGFGYAAGGERPSGAPAQSSFGPPTDGLGPTLPPPVPDPTSGPSMPPGLDAAVATQSQHDGAVPVGMPPHIDAARDAVNQAMSAVPPSNPAPIQALNAQPLGEPLRPTAAELSPAQLPPVDAPQPGADAGAGQEGSVSPPPAGSPPPPVPPPMMPPAQNL